MDGNSFELFHIIKRFLQLLFILRGREKNYLIVNENLECNMSRDENSDKKPTPHELERVYKRSFACMLLLFSTYPLPLLRLRRFP